MLIFQYESTGMQKYLRDLVPTKFEDLIAMNALYRPGPLAYIPSFVNRKHGREPIKYDLAAMEEYLKETYGITVYQEQVMLLSQKLANFTKGEADMLRKAMGKKKKKLIDQMFPKFLEGCTKNGHPQKVVEKIWKDWEAFASYAFNKSHSTCYALVAFQTAYLKAHHPGEFMASVLTHNKNDITKLTFFLRECKRMGIEVLGPDVNESLSDFAVNKKGHVRFGLSALKGVGEGPVGAVLEERKKSGTFKNVFDMMRRLDLRSFNKKCLDSLVLGGGLDCFEEIKRWNYFSASEKYDTFNEHLLKYGNAYQSQKAQAVNSLFGDSDEILIPEPKVPEAQQWSLIEKLTREKEVTGIYISGHPLDDYKLEIENYTTCTLDQIENFKGTKVNVAGVVIAANHRVDKKGNGYGFFTIQDYNGMMELALWRDDYNDYSNRMSPGEVVFIKGKYEFNSYREEYQFRVQEIQQLASIGLKMTESITLKLPLQQITNDLIDEIELICKKHKGKLPLKMEVLEPENQIKLKMRSISRKVNVDGDMIAELDKIGVRYKLNA